MKLAIVAVVFFSALATLLWISIASGSVPVHKVHEIASGKYDTECRIDDGKIHSIQKMAEPLRFTIQSEKNPGTLLEVESERHPPDNFKPDISVSVRGCYDPRRGVFVAKDVVTRCPSKYKAKEKKTGASGSYGDAKGSDLGGAESSNFGGAR